MNHDEQGQGLPLLLIHVFPHDRTLWEPQLDGLKDVARVIAPDLRGFGSAETVPETMTMDDYAADLKALLDELGIPGAVICGLSMGGYVALAFLARYPDATKGLILCNTRAGADNEKAREGRYATAQKALDEGMAAIAEGMVPKMLSGADVFTHPDLRSSVENMMARQSPEAVAAAAHGMALRPDRTAMLSSIKVPVLVITGSEDTLIPPSEAMAAKIPGSDFAVIPKVAHLSNLEDAEAFNDAVRTFLGRMA
jgi:pimeloyl-ACP methyl ester carboxylesterase